MAQTYKIDRVGSVGDNAPHEWQSGFGPMIAYTLKLDGVEAPVKLNQKPETRPPQVGQELYGVIDMSAKGGPKFNKEQRVVNAAPTIDKPTYQPRDDAAIKAQFAIKAAIQFSMTQNTTPTIEDIEVYAHLVYDMVDKVKDDTRNMLSDSQFDTF